MLWSADPTRLTLAKFSRRRFHIPDMAIANGTHAGMKSVGLRCSAHGLGQFIPLYLIYGFFVSQHPTCIASTLLSLFLYLNSLFSSQAVSLSVTDTDSLALVTLLVFVHQTGLLPAP